MNHAFKMVVIFELKMLQMVHISINSSFHILLLWGAAMNTQRLTYCGLATQYGQKYLGQRWLRKWLVVWRHQAIVWTDVD